MRTDELLTVARASLRAGLDARLIRNAIRDGEIPAIRPGERALYVAWPDVERWLDTRRVTRNEEPHR